MKIKDICDLLEYDEFHPNEWIARKNQHKNEAIKDISNLEVKLTLNEDRIYEIISEELNKGLLDDLSTADILRKQSNALKSKAGELIGRGK